MNPLPRLYVIIDQAHPEQSAEDLRAAVVGAAAAGARFFQLRLKGWSSAAKWSFGQRVAADLVGFRACLLVNDRVDLALLLAADGVHRPADGLGLRQMRQLWLDGLYGVSCHSEAELSQAEAEGANFATLSPVFPPSSKADTRDTLSAAGFSSLAGTTSLPVFALGGIGPDSVAEMLAAGAYGVAVLGGIMGAPDPYASTASYLAALADS